MQRWSLLVALALLMGGLTPSATAQAAERCFPETGFCIAGRIREFWEQNGGLAVFGYPKGPQQTMTIEGQTIQAQQFERNRLELHPENARPYDVLLGRLGADRLAQQGRDPFTFLAGTPQPDCRYFPETRHNICGDVLTLWRANGLEFDGRPGKSEGESLALFGLPLSELQTEEIDGRAYQVQWFERARFELHPGNAPPYHVQLGLLGNETIAGAGATRPAEPRPLPLPSFKECQEDPNPGAAPNHPVQIVAVDKAAETVTLRNVGPEPIDLTGWRMCSIKGNQEHPIGGVLAPNESRTFDGPVGNIWSNSETDNASLYNPQGQLVSYRADR